jgi:hypothetical protein
MCVCAGVEVLDVEANWERHYRDDLIKTYAPPLYADHV